MYVTLYHIGLQTKKVTPKKQMINQKKNLQCEKNKNKKNNCFNF